MAQALESASRFAQVRLFVTTGCMVPPYRYTFGSPLLCEHHHGIPPARPAIPLVALLSTRPARTGQAAVSGFASYSPIRTAGAALPPGCRQAASREGTRLHRGLALGSRGVLAGAAAAARLARVMTSPSLIPGGDGSRVARRSW